MVRSNCQAPAREGGSRELARQRPGVVRTALHGAPAVDGSRPVRRLAVISRLCVLPFRLCQPASGVEYSGCDFGGELFRRPRPGGGRRDLAHPRYRGLGAAVATVAVRARGSKGAYRTRLSGWPERRSDPREGWAPRRGFRGTAAPRGSRGDRPRHDPRGGRRGARHDGACVSYWARAAPLMTRLRLIHRLTEDQQASKPNRGIPAQPGRVPVAQGSLRPCGRAQPFRLYPFRGLGISELGWLRRPHGAPFHCARTADIARTIPTERLASWSVSCRDQAAAIGPDR